MSLNGRSSHMNFAFSIPIVTWNVTKRFQRKRKLGHICLSWLRLESKVPFELIKFRLFNHLVDQNLQNSKTLISKQKWGSQTISILVRLSSNENLCDSENLLILLFSTPLSLGDFELQKHQLMLRSSLN